MIAIILTLVLFLSAYIIGKQHGKAEGYTKGVSAGVLELRQKSLETGYCLLCQPGKETIDISLKDNSRKQLHPN